MLRGKAGSWSAKAGKLALSGVMVMALTPAIAMAQDYVADSGVSLKAQADGATTSSVTLSKVTQDGKDYIWPDGAWTQTADEAAKGIYKWSTYIKGDGAHYGHYDATVTFTVEDKTLTAIDLSSAGVTPGAKWGSISSHNGGVDVNILPEGVTSTTDVGAYATDHAIATVGLTGCGSAGEAGTYGGYTISSLKLLKANSDGTVVTEKVPDDDGDGTIDQPAGYDVATDESLRYETKGRRGSTVAYYSLADHDVDSAAATWDSASKKLTVKDVDAGYNVLSVVYRIGDFYDFETRYALTDEAGAKAYAAEVSDLTADPFGFGLKNRDTYTAAAYALILQRELPSWIVSMNDENATGEIEDLDIISAATKSSDSVIESLYASQGYSYPVANHDDATATKADWDKIFTEVASDLAITMDGEEVSGDATAVTKNGERQFQLANDLFGEDIAVAGFDLYAIEDDMKPAEAWDLGKGKQKESDALVASYLTNNISTTGHGLVGTYGVEGSGLRDKEAGADVLDDDVMAYDPSTRTLTVKNDQVTHVVVQYAVGKFNDAAGGTCGVVYDLDDLYSDVMYRLYNPYSGEHFYTASAEERDNVVAEGWNDEGIGWFAPGSGKTVPVYRLYNAYGGEHHYTMSAEERDNLVAAGWTDEGIGWYSDATQSVGLYREYNPNAFANNHNYTTNKEEHDGLISLGWIDESDNGNKPAWYAVEAAPAPAVE